MKKTVDFRSNYVQEPPEFLEIHSALQDLFYPLCWILHTLYPRKFKFLYSRCSTDSIIRLFLLPSDLGLLQSNLGILGTMSFLDFELNSKDVQRRN